MKASCLNAHAPVSPVGVVKKEVELLQKYVPAAQILANFSVDAEHSWPTNSYGNGGCRWAARFANRCATRADCATLGSPYINRCQMHASYRMVDWLLSPLMDIKRPVPAQGGNVRAGARFPLDATHADDSAV